MVRQELASEKGIEGSLAVEERDVEPWRRELGNKTLATAGFEIPPGRHLQVAYGQCQVSTGGEVVRVPLAVLILGYSHGLLVRTFLSEKQNQIRTPTAEEHPVGTFVIPETAFHPNTPTVRSRPPKQKSHP